MLGVRLVLKYYYESKYILIHFCELYFYNFLNNTNTHTYMDCPRDCSKVDRAFFLMTADLGLINSISYDPQSTMGRSLREEPKVIPKDCLV